MTTAHSLYITLNFLRRENGVNKYHWGLFATDGTPPAGTLYHATDVGHQPLELFKEVRQIRNPQTSKTMVVVLRVTSTPGTQNLDYFSSASFVHLMDRRYLPQGEQYWTCRVWVKEVLKTLHNNRRIVLPANVVVPVHCGLQHTKHGLREGIQRPKLDVLELDEHAVPHGPDGNRLYGAFYGKLSVHRQQDVYRLFLDASIDKLDNVVHSSGRIEPVPPAWIFLPLYLRSKLTQRVPHPVPVLEPYQRIVHAMLEEDRRVANDVRMVRYTVLQADGFTHLGQRSAEERAPTRDPQEGAEPATSCNGNVEVEEDMCRRRGTHTDPSQDYAIPAVAK
ncbi:hypothetical protein ONZ51_g13430 [Trametes cubensis]|uniref:Uncharacterized protein n=1 Tax=Trametes cubensis TaxID=1111947 RepID=A0AAD7TEF3_9APHY|nr:hypothetical protein ONZ51_g13430 [Trametes cubensis]